MDTDDSQNGSFSPPLSPVLPGSPLCLFHFSHPFRVVGPQESDQAMARRRREALEAVVKKRQQILSHRPTRNRNKTVYNRRVWRRYLRDPFWDLKTHLFAHNAAGTSTSLDEVLTTIRKAWEPPRCLSLERDSGSDEKAEASYVSTGEGMSRKQVPANPSLPHRRYSVPETVMRKYSLTKQRSGGSSDSGVATVPVYTPETISSHPYLHSSPDTSENSDSTMGNRGSRRTRSIVSSESVKIEQPSRSTMNTVSEEINDAMKGKVSGDTLERVSSLNEDITYSSPVEKQDQDTPDGVGNLKHDNSSTQTPVEESDEVTSSQTINIMSSESKKMSSQDDAANMSEEKIQHSTSNGKTGSDLSGLIDQTASSPDNNKDTKLAQPSEKASEKNISPSQSSGNENRSDETPEPQSSGKDCISSSQSREIESSESKATKTPEEVRQLQSAGYRTNKASEETPEPQSSAKDELSSSETRGVDSRESKSNEESEITPEPQTSGKDDLSSSQTFGVESSQSNVNKERHKTSESIDPQSTTENGSSSSSTPEVESTENEQGSSRKNKERTNSRKDISSRSSLGKSPLDNETIPEPEGSQASRTSTNLKKDSVDRTRSSTPHDDLSFTPTECCVSTPERSLSSDRASASCSITPVTQSSDSSSSGSSPERPSVTLRSSPEQPSSDHTLSTQDATLSIKSDSVILDRPVSVLARRSESNKQLQVSDSEQSIGHLEFMNESVDNESHPLHDILARALTQSKSQSTDSNSQHTADSGHATEPEFCGTSKLNSHKPVTVADNDQSTACGILIQHPTVELGNADKDQELPAKTQGMDLFGSKTNSVIRPDADRKSSPSSENSIAPYSWSTLTDEERLVRLQHQRHRLWMNRRLSAANALPASPLHGPLSYGVGPGSTYRKSFDVQLVVPRYSALPRSVSMLVNTSSGECSSNSNSDSECLSLVDSLEEGPKSTKHDSKLVRGDIMHMLPEGTTSNRINPATPRGKGKAFFVSMAGGLDEAGKVELVENVEKPIVAQSMPDRLRKKLSQRHQKIELEKKKKKRIKAQNENVPKDGLSNCNERNTEHFLNNKDTNLLRRTSLISQQELSQLEASRRKPSHRRRDSISGPIQMPNEGKVQNVDKSNQIRKMTSAIFYPLPQSSADGTFIVLKKEAEKKPADMELFIDTLQVGQMIEKEDIPEGLSPPVKRYRASSNKSPPKKENGGEEQNVLKVVKNYKNTKMETNQEKLAVHAGSTEKTLEREETNGKTALVMGESPQLKTIVKPEEVSTQPNMKSAPVSNKTGVKNKNQKVRKSQKENTMPITSENQIATENENIDISKLSNAEKLAAIGKGTVELSPSPKSNGSSDCVISESNDNSSTKERLKQEGETAKKNDNKVLKKKNKTNIQTTTSPKTHSVDGNGNRGDDKKAVSCQTSPQPNTAEEKSTSTPNTPPETDKSITNSGKPQLKSGIPIMKSPGVSRKLSPDTAITLRKNSHLPIRRPPRQLHAPPVRRSANLLGSRYRQRFEVIPEERSVSLESSTEDQNKQTNDRTNIVSHSCLGYAKQKQQRRQESSSSNYDETTVSSTTETTTSSDAKKPTGQSRIPKLSQQQKLSEEKKPAYQGKASLAPHTEDNDLLAISKGWINFYLLKEGRSTPDSVCSESSDKEERRRHRPLTKTVTIMGGDDNRIRQYTVTTTLPELNNNNVRQHSLERLPVTVVQGNDSVTDSDQSTTYMCLPNPRVRHSNLLEGSGELACSESSVSSSSDSEYDQVISPAVMPLRWPPTRPNRKCPRSRSRTKHYKSEQFHPNGGASAGWTVTVAGSNPCPQQPPELEMRLSFPTCARQPAASQSDSGLGEDNNHGDKPKERLSEEDENKDDDDNEEQSRHFLPPAQSAPPTHRWTVMLKKQGGMEKRGYHCLPDLDQKKSSKRVIKRPETSFPVSSINEEDTWKSKKYSVVWPKMQKIIESKVVIRKSSGEISHLLEAANGSVVVRSGLEITGSAITPEKKPPVPKMSERDLTRRSHQ